MAGAAVCALGEAAIAVGGGTAGLAIASPPGTLSPPVKKEMPTTAPTTMPMNSTAVRSNAKSNLFTGIQALIRSGRRRTLFAPG